MSQQLSQNPITFNHWYIERLLSLASLILFTYIFVTGTLTTSLYFFLKFVVFLHVYFGLKGIFKDYVFDDIIRTLYIILTQILLIKLFFIV